ncbi:uncharacterized protein [Mytilus edulis]|uniref:uncharacterized protein n=1 Tax=Mytilus edulis TaxID=6550 RepID=UPI0039F0FBAD
MFDSLQTTFPMNLSEQTMNSIYNESHDTHTYDYENKTYSTDGDGEHANDSDYINYVIWTGCILFIIIIVVSSSICYTLNTNLLLKHSANVKSAQEKGTVAAVANRSKNACDTINQQTMCLDHDMEIQVVTKEAVVKNRNED